MHNNEFDRGMGLVDTIIVGDDLVFAWYGRRKFPKAILVIQFINEK